MLSNATETSVRGFTSTLLPGDWTVLVPPLLTAAPPEPGSDTCTNFNLFQQGYFNYPTDENGVTTHSLAASGDPAPVYHYHALEDPTAFILKVNF
jgi:hypothetical protein